MSDFSIPSGDRPAFKRRSVVRADESDERAWLRQSRLCPLLAQHHIAHVGVIEAEHDFEILRREQSGTFMLACFEGAGEVMADGVWKKIRSGQACLLPPFVTNRLQSVVGHPWMFAYVRYLESREHRPIVSSVSPVTGVYDAGALRAAIMGLHAECRPNGASPSALHHWCELIHHYVLVFAQPHQEDDRLWRVWQRVEADLAHPWTLAELARSAYMSEEHLRRLCRKQIGRSPMRHVTFLRLQRAKHLLAVTDEKIETISRAVGFETVSAFSNTFVKWVGWRPSKLRKR